MWRKKCIQVKSNCTAITFQHIFTHTATTTPTYVTDVKMHKMVKVTRNRNVAALTFNLSTKMA
jgi:AraC-like DNA-binding protein